MSRLPLRSCLDVFHEQSYKIKFDHKQMFLSKSLITSTTEKPCFCLPKFQQFNTRSNTRSVLCSYICAFLGSSVLLFSLFLPAMKFCSPWIRKSTEWMVQYIIIYSIVFYIACWFCIFIGGCWYFGCLLNKSKQGENLVKMFDLVSWICARLPDANFCS